jgi:hypothetical protein
MNQLLPYEQQIAEQMQRAPVPDMQDAVWARIEAILDAEMDAAENQPDETIIKHQIKKYSVPKVSVLVIILAVVIAMLINRKQSSNRVQKPKKETTVPVKQQTSTKEGKSLPDEPALLPVAEQKVIKANKNSLETGNDDSVFIMPPVQQVKPESKRNDSVLKINPPLIIKPQKDSIKKKPRGVSGISDSDYRFVMPEKDSIH